MARGVFNYIERDAQYYPTPAKLLKSIMYNLDMKYSSEVCINFLEPCAGDGAICRELKKYFESEEKSVCKGCKNKDEDYAPKCEICGEVEFYNADCPGCVKLGEKIYKELEK